MYSIRSTYTEGIEHPYGSIFVIPEVTYKDVGYYYCALNDTFKLTNDPSDDAEFQNAMDASKIYLFVNGKKMAKKINKLKPINFDRNSLNALFFGMIQMKIIKWPPSIQPISSFTQHKTLTSSFRVSRRHDISLWNW